MLTHVHEACGPVPDHDLDVALSIGATDPNRLELGETSSGMQDGSGSPSAATLCRVYALLEN